MILQKNVVYVSCSKGVLDDGPEHFESGSDIYDAIGEMLLQGQERFTHEKEIQDMCSLFYSAMKS